MTPGSVGYLRRCNLKRIRDDRHRRGLIQNGHGGRLGRARPHHLIDVLSQKHRADPKSIVDLNRCCDAVHVTPEINIHQQQVRVILAGYENGLLPRGHRPDEDAPKRVEKVGESESRNRVSFSDQDAKWRWGRS